jgi:hypothetical protein
VPGDYHNQPPIKRNAKYSPELVEAVGDVVVPHLMPAIALISNTFADALPETPSGGFVPWRNRRVFVTARRSYRGDKSAHDEFAAMLGMSTLSSDHLLALPALLAPTFDAKRVDSRTEWELMRSDEAISSLASRWEKLAQREKEGVCGWGTKSIKPILLDPLDPSSDPRAVTDPDLVLVFLRERVHSSLDDKRLSEVALMHAAEFDWERPSETTRLVAESLNMHPRTIRRDRDRLRTHPEFLREFGRAL